MEPVPWRDLPDSFDFRLASIPLMYRGQAKLYTRANAPNVDELYFNLDEHISGFQQRLGVEPVAFRIFQNSSQIEILCQSARCDLFDAGSGFRAALGTLRNTERRTVSISTRLVIEAR